MTNPSYHELQCPINFRPTRWAPTSYDCWSYNSACCARGSLPTATSPMVGPPSTGRTQKQLLVTGLPGCAAIETR